MKSTTSIISRAIPQQSTDDRDPIERAELVNEMFCQRWVVADDRSDRPRIVSPHD